MADRLSYREFKDEFLLGFALACKGDTSSTIDPAKAASMVTGTYQKSWIAAATKELKDQGYIAGMAFLAGGGSFNLTGAGLDRAEGVAHENGADLYELIEETFPTAAVDENGNTLTDDQGNHLVFDFDLPDYALPARVTRVDPLSQAFRELDYQMALALRDLRASNSISEIDGAEVAQRMAEVEAGKALLKAPQVDANLFNRLVLPALNYLAKKVADETVKAGLQKLIALVASFFGPAV